MSKTKLIILALGVIVIGLTGCGGPKKMAKKYNEVKYTVEPLAVSGGKVTTTIKGTVPPKYFHKKTVEYFQPVLETENGTIPLKPFYIKGGKVMGEGITIDQKAGGAFTYTDVVDYKPGMENAKLVVKPVAYKSKDVKANKTQQDALANKGALVLGSSNLADGINTTETRVDKKNSQTATAANGYEKETIIPKKADIYFVVNESNLAWNLPLNKDQAHKDALTALNDQLKKDWAVKNIEINAWASPEGEESLNQNLSLNRSKTAEKYMKDQINAAIKEIDKANTKEVEVPGSKKKQKVVTTPAKLKADAATVSNAKGEDWDGFLVSMQNSNIAEKNTILNVVKSQPDRTKREQEIRNMTVVYKEIEDQILPPLRRAEMVVNFYEPKKTDAEIAQFSTTNPKQLSEKELLYAATLTNDLNTQMAIYKSATELYPQSWQAWNNAGVTAFKLAKFNDSKSYLEKANSLSANNMEVLNNLGATALALGDTQGAKSYFESAAKAGSKEAASNVGALKISAGDYSGAASAYGTNSCTYNAALAQLLANRIDDALKTLDCAPQNAEVSYLKAVCNARKDNAAGIYTNLQSAIKADANYKNTAKKDVEFKKYWNQAEFQNIVK